MVYLTRYLFIITTLLCLLIDIVQFFLLGTVIVPLMLSIYCVLLFVTVNTLFIAYVIVLLCLESFCFYNYFLLPLIYSIPMAALSLYYKKNFYPSPLYISYIAIFYGLIESYAIHPFFFNIYPVPTYTIIKICVIIVVEICFYLTIKYWGMLDNHG